VRTGASTYFNNYEHPISMLHILASASLPPGFPPTEINGEYYWNGAVVSITPMQHVIDTRQRDSALIFQVDLWDPNGELPLDIPSAFLRATEIHSASRVNISLEQYKKWKSLETRFAVSSADSPNNIKTTTQPERETPRPVQHGGRVELSTFLAGDPRPV